jgi:16S rRNA (guanine527-N7)-methyltransferase
VDIPSLLRPFLTDSLSPTQLDQVSTYLDLLLRWNARMNLTSIRDPQQIITRHFGESFFLARALQLPITNHQLQILDLGSGAGFPGIPLKIACPGVTITLVEAQQRKATFLREVIRALHLDMEVKNVRAEILPPATADIVTLRAVEKFDSILPLAARLVRRQPSPAGGPEASPGEVEGSMQSGLALLISNSQVPRAHELLPKWRFRPGISIPNSQNRVIQLVEPPK